MKSDAWIPLNKIVIQKNIIQKNSEIILFSSIDSTNNYLKSCEFSKKNLICLSESQTDGKGRLGKVWYSPFGENIYLSVRKTILLPASKLQSASLVLALAVRKALFSMIPLCASLRIKWPNDLMWNDKKIGGILIELISTKNHQTTLVLGVGLNVNSHEHSMHCLKRPVSSLFEITNRYHDRNILVAEIINTFESYFALFEKHGFSFFLKEWETCDYLKGRFFSIQKNDAFWEGVGQGITEDGYLIIKNDCGVENCFSSGEIILEPRQR